MKLIYLWNHGVVLHQSNICHISCTGVIFVLVKMYIHSLPVLITRQSFSHSIFFILNILLLILQGVLSLILSSEKWLRFGKHCIIQSRLNKMLKERSTFSQYICTVTNDIKTILDFIKNLGYSAKISLICAKAFPTLMLLISRQRSQKDKIYKTSISPTSFGVFSISYR